MRLSDLVISAAQWRLEDGHDPHAPTAAEQETLALSIVQQAQALGGAFSLAETSTLVRAVERSFPPGNAYRMGLWSHLLGAGLNPNALLMTCPRGPGWDDNFEPVYFAARNAAELEQFIAHGADPRVTDDTGYGEGPTRYRRLIDLVQASKAEPLQGSTKVRYDADMLPILKGWNAAVAPAESVPAAPRARTRMRR